MSVNHSKSLVLLANTVGDFIRYWGFRRIHGELWTLIFLAKKPMSGAELSSALKVSKALVSPALKELEEYKLIFQTDAQDAKTKRYEANPDVFGVIQQILVEREMVILQEARSNYNLLRERNDDSLDSSRLKELGEMINAANGFIKGVAKMDSMKKMKFLARVVS